MKVSITDNGKGLNEEEITHVFDKYYKGKTDRKQMDSSGLGLNICKSIVQKHGGTISVSSPGPGKGSTFSFTIPLNDESAKPCCKKEQNPKQHIEDIHTKIDSIIAEN